MQQLAASDEGCRKLIEAETARLSSSPVGTPASDRQARKKRAQERAMADLAKQREKFAAMMAQAEEAEGAEGTRGQAAAGESAEEVEAPSCIICHQSDEEPLGFIGFAQASRVMGRRGAPGPRSGSQQG